MLVTNKIKNIFALTRPGMVVDLVLKLTLLVTAICIFVPFSPAMPTAGLDSSWMFGMNQAVAQGFSLGREIIFTFGPYASIYTTLYHPSTDFMMVSGGLYLAFSYWICLALLVKDVWWRWILAFFVLVSAVFSRDALLFSFPLLVGFASLKITSLEYKSRLTIFYLALLFTPLGLLPLVKGSLLILCIAIVALSSLLFVISKHTAYAATCVVFPFASILFFWFASGQSMVVLSDYFIGMIPIISGYTEAMAIDGSISEVILYLLTAILLLFSILLQKQITGTPKVFLFCIYFVFLFLAFKAGFVRHDAHAVISGTSIFIAALLLPFIFNMAAVIPTIILALITFFYTINHYDTISAVHFPAIYPSAWDGLKNRIIHPNWPRQNFDVAVKSLQKQAVFPVLPGTTDIYSYNQSYLLASGNVWSTRPIFQSYSVYTPMLAEKNKNHLLGAQAPDNVIFRVEPIDGRIPSIEDGASWPVLMANYRPTQIMNGFLFLRKKENIGAIPESLALMTGKFSFGESVDPPILNQPVFVNIEIEPTTLGRLAGILFKPSQLQIALELENGERRQYRIIASMAKAGFLLSPLVEDTIEFGMLYGENGYLNGKFVKSFSVTPSGSSILWNEKYTVTFHKIKTDPIDVLKIYKFDTFIEKLPDIKNAVTEKCEGSIDRINGIPLAPGQLSVSRVLTIKGWLTTSINEPIPSEAVYVVLTDTKGKHLYFKTRQELRLDVGDYFKKPELNNSGYSTIADVGALEGTYTLGLAIKQHNKIMNCSQFNTPLTINKAGNYAAK